MIDIRLGNSKLQLAQSLRVHAVGGGAIVFDAAAMREFAAVLDQYEADCQAKLDRAEELHAKSRHQLAECKAAIDDGEMISRRVVIFGGLVAVFWICALLIRSGIL